MGAFVGGQLSVFQKNSAVAHTEINIPQIAVDLSKFVAAGASRQVLSTGPAQRWVQREHRTHALIAQNVSKRSQHLLPLKQSGAKVNKPGS